MAMQQQHGNNGGTVLMVLATAIIAFFAGWAFGGGLDFGDDTETTGAAAQDGGEIVGDSEDIPIGDSPVRGNPEAPVTVVEFTSMQCPMCSRVAPTLDELLEEYPDEVRLVFKHFPLGNQPQSEDASKIMIAAGKQDEAKFWEMKDALFENLSDYGDPMEDLGAELAEDLGLDVDQFREDFNSDETQEIVDQDRQLGAELGVRGTPAFMINGEEFVGAQPISEFKSAVDEQLELVEQLREDGVEEDELYAEAVRHNLEGGNDDAEEEARREEPDEREQQQPEDDGPDIHHIEVRDDDAVKGADEDDALVTIMEFASYQCPHCATGNDTMNELIEEHGDEVRVVFKHFPLPMQQQSEPASRAAVAAGEQGEFWAMNDLLFENQRRLSDDLFEELAQEIGLDIEQFREDFESEETAAIVEQAQSDGREAGVRGTPAFAINGVIEGGAQPLATFERHIAHQSEIAREIQEEQGLTGDDLYEAVVEHNQEHYEEPSGADLLDVGDSYTKGADDPELKIYEFSSFQCPFCARAADNMEEVMDRYGDQVQLVYKNFPLPNQQQSEPAARAALAAGEQGQFWEMYEMLYDNQDRFAEDGFFEEMAQDIGLNLDQFREDFESDALARQVRAEQQQGQAAGVRGTPAFFIGDEEVRGAQPPEDIIEIIEDQLEG